MSLRDDTLLRLAETVLSLCRARGLTVAAAESCTGGMITAALTAIVGSSDVVDRGFVTYSNSSKTDMLGVPAALIEAHGAVSAQVAEAMAAGALAHAPVDLAISVTGIAGPGGASPAKPVGLVYFGIARRDGWCRTERHVFAGNRASIRHAAAVRALEMLSAAAS